MMENRKKVGLMIIGIALLVLAIIVILFLKKEKQIPSDQQVTATTTLNTQNLDESAPTPTSLPGERPDNYRVYDISQEEPHQLDANDASKLSVSFVERLGSFSNQSDYSNMTDLKIFMTNDMREWTDKTVAEYKAADYSGEYYGIMTKALTSKVLSYDKKAGQAKIEVMAERREDRANNLGEPFRQKMTLELIENDGQWLVDSAYWEKK